MLFNIYLLILLYIAILFIIYNNCFWFILNVQAEQKRSSDEILNHELSSAVSHKVAEPQHSEDDDLYENLPKTHLEIDECHQSYTLQQAERTKELQVFGVF